MAVQNVGVAMVRLPGLRERYGFEKSSIYHWMSIGRFPRPVKVGQRAVAWRLSDLLEWESKQQTAAELAGCAAT
jgi:prophage regulatory protein